MIIPNCPNNKEVVNTDEQSGHFKIFLVFSKRDSGKVTDVNGSTLLRTVKVSVKVKESLVQKETS